MKITEALNRGFNLLAVSILALTGLAFMSEIFLETEWGDKADDLGLVILGLIAVIWYFSKDKKFVRSAVPLVLVLLGFVDKLIGVIVEFKDKEAVGDDMGGLVLFICAAILIVYQYFRTKKLLAQAGPEQI